MSYQSGTLGCPDPCSCPSLYSICGASGCSSLVTVMGQYSQPNWSLLGVLTGHSTSWIMNCGSATLIVVGVAKGHCNAVVEAWEG